MLQRISSYFSTYPEVYRDYSRYLREQKWRIALMSLVLIIITVANTSLLWLIGKPLMFIHQDQIGPLNQVLMIISAVVFIKYALHLSYDTMRYALGLRFICEVRQAFLSQIMRLSSNGTAGYSKGDLLARLSNDIEQLKTIMVEIPLLILSHTMVLSVFITMLVWIDWRLAIIALGIAPLFYIQQRILAPKKGRASQAFYRYNGELLGFEDQVVMNLHGITSFNAELQIQEKHAEVIEKTRFWSLRALIIDAIHDAGFSWLTLISAIVLVYFGVDAIQAGRMDAGSLISFILFLGYLSVPLRGLAQVPLQFQGALGAVTRLNELNNAQPLIQANLGSIKIPNQADAAGRIELENIHFSFSEGPPIFAGVSCCFDKGETIAIVGASGAGKTTLVNLLLRFFDLNAGSIKVNGLDVRDWPINELRAQFSVVWQQAFLINGTIRENLRLAKRDAGEKAIQTACELSHCWEFISRLPQGLDTPIGPGGVVLSAGQCQRLSIAQAFLRNAPFLILDEASSALDSESEQAIVGAVETLRRGRTTLIIAHRYSSLRNADRVCYLNGDGSIDIGSHEELIRSHNEYQAAIAWQTGGENSGR
ncbi:MAG: ABC transporter ATP-binding protein [Thiohalomonadales bacterium]